MMGVMLKTGFGASDRHDRTATEPSHLLGGWAGTYIMGVLLNKGCGAGVMIGVGKNKGV